MSAAPIHAQGLVLAGVGPVNRSMGGASVGSPLDAAGSLYWNPATIGGLPSSQLDFGIELLDPRAKVSSTIPAGALGPAGPSSTLSGTTRSEAGIFPLPSGGLVYKPDDSSWTFGLGVFAIGGFGTNYPGSTTNPIFSPPPPNGFGLGPVASVFQVLQLAPTVSYKLTDRLFLGVAPTIDLAALSLDPAVLFPPDDADGDGIAHYPTATHTRIQWGAGFQVGAYYVASESWRFGASFKSPQWFETFRFQGADELGRARPLAFRLDYPMISSVGLAYTGFDRLIIASDVRYIGFKNTAGFSHAGFDPSGAVTGLGWNDAFAFALGAQYQLTESLSLRTGYTFNTNPIPDVNSSFNIASPPIYQHELAIGASYRLTPACTLSATYYHIFSNTITGPFFTAVGPIPGASVATTAVGDSLIVGASVSF